MTATVADMENRFDEFLDLARQETVTIERNGQDYVVMISAEEYERLRAIEDRLWAERAIEAEKSGFLSPEESMKFILSRLTED